MFVARIFGDAEDAGESANDVAVEDRFWFVERDARDCAGGGASNSGQGEDVVEVAGKFAVVFSADFLRGLLKIAGTGVITKTFPKFENFFRFRTSERFDGRQNFHPAFPIWHDGFDLCLLKHDFGNPDGVRISRVTPRKVASIF